MRVKQLECDVECLPPFRARVKRSGSVIYTRVGILILATLLYLLIQHTYRVHIFTDPRCTPQSYVEHIPSDEGVA